MTTKTIAKLLRAILEAADSVEKEQYLDHYNLEAAKEAGKVHAIKQLKLLIETLETE